MNKKTRAVAILLVAVMILSLVASMVIPYLENNARQRCTWLPAREREGERRARRGTKGGILFPKRMPPLEPQEKDLDWQSQAWMTFMPPE